jgi:hypothetical protein
MLPAKEQGRWDAGKSHTSLSVNKLGDFLLTQPVEFHSLALAARQTRTK